MKRSGIKSSKKPMKRGPLKKKSKGKRKKRRLNKKDPQTKSDWQAVADDLWAVLIKERDNYTCQYCGRTDRVLNSHHIFTRSYKSTRHDLDNGITLCGMPCHRNIAHEKPEEFRDFLLTWMGEVCYNQLKDKAKTVCNNYDPERWVNEASG